MLWNGNECGKFKSDENLNAAIQNTDYDTSKTAGECGFFFLLVAW
jgi:hypothetical protein